MIGHLPSPWTANGEPITDINPSAYARDYQQTVADERRLVDACADLIADGWSPWDAAAITYR